MATIRRFDQRAVEEFHDGNIPGVVHAYIGQEAIAVGVCTALPKDDQIASTHRGHGHTIAKGADIKLTTAELSLHPYHEAKAGGVATPNNPRHSAHGPGSEEGRDEPQTAGKTTAGQRARPVH